MSQHSAQSIGFARTQCKFCPCYKNYNRLCGCKYKKPIIFTSLTSKNLVRRFAKCKNEDSGNGCGFFEWVDDELYPFVKRHVQALIAQNEFLESKIVGMVKLRNEREDEKELTKKFVEKNSRPKQVVIGYEAREKLVMWLIVFVVVLIAFGAVVFKSSLEPPILLVHMQAIIHEKKNG